MARNACLTIADNFFNSLCTLLICQYILQKPHSLVSTQFMHYIVFFKKNKETTLIVFYNISKAKHYHCFVFQIINI
jgi:hypothetical protein